MMIWGCLSYMLQHTTLKDDTILQTLREKPGEIDFRDSESAILRQDDRQSWEGYV